MMLAFDKRMYQKGLTAMVLMGSIFVSYVFMQSMGPSAAVKYNTSRPVRVDVSEMKVGEVKEVSWADRPVYILRRAPEEVANLNMLDAELSDPHSIADPDFKYIEKTFRSIKPEFFVVVGVSTHCGCILSYTKDASNWKNMPGGFFYDACHVATYDVAGRVLAASAAPSQSKYLPSRVTNLVIPPHRYVSSTEIVIGEALQDRSNVH